MKAVKPFLLILVATTSRRRAGVGVSFRAVGGVGCPSHQISKEE
jgi:hypothetical protein